ncbi:MAG: hypothetical protein E7335_11810, partial [Clostridiales bacterium]|nr:hypothetical protein [Clostridiales bacterium]
MRKDLWRALLALCVTLFCIAGGIGQAESASIPIETKIEYIGGEITRGYVGGEKTRAISLDDRVTVAYVMPEAGELTVGEESVWHAVIEGGTEPYSYRYVLYHKSFDDPGNTYTYVEGSMCESNESTYTFLIPEDGWYLMQFRVTDATGEYVVFQSARFATSTDEIRLLVDEIIDAAVKEDMSDYEKALVLHDCLCDSAEYDDSLTIHEPVGVLLQKTGVCESFALAYQMLLGEAGVENIYVEGYGGDEAHAWNMIRLDGEWYHVDVTWDEATNDRYFFGMTDELIGRSHTITSRVPAANGTKYNYALANSDGAFGSLDELMILFQQLPEDQEYFNFYYTGNELIADAFYAWCQDNGDIIKLATYGCVSGEMHTHYVYGSRAVSNLEAQYSPAVPDHLAVVEVGENSVQLSWIGNEKAKAYEVFASVNNSGYRLLASVAGEECVVSDLEDGTWRFKVRAVYDDECSVFTKAVYMTVGQGALLGFPMGLTAEIAAEHAVYLTWDEVENATGYRVYASKSGSDYTLCGEANTNNFFAKYLVTGSTYRFRVSAIRNVDGIITESEYSEDCGILLNRPAASDESLFSISQAGTITAYSGNDKNLVVPETINGYTVTTIGSGVFKNASFETIILPDTISQIGSSAFENCTALKYIKLPTELKSLSQSVFRGCTSLEAVSFNNKLTSVYECCFYDCPALKEIRFPESVISMRMRQIVEGCTSLEMVSLPANAGYADSYRAFYNCVSLKSITIPETLTSIDNQMFEKCKALTEINVPSKVTLIGSFAFGDCTALKRVILPNGLKTIGGGAFQKCSSLESISIPSTVTSIGSNTFLLAEKLRHIDLPQELTKLGTLAFYGCTSLIEIEIPSGVTALESSTFVDCESLRKVTLSEGLQKIDDMCFDGCNALRELTIPSTVKTIGDDVFNYATEIEGINKIEGLTKIYLNCADVEFSEYMVSDYCADAPLLFIAPAGSNAYALCEQYGYLCMALGGEIHLTAGYSTDAENPTMLKSDTISLNLDNLEGVEFETVALISEGRVYSFPFDNHIIRPYSAIVNRYTDGNTITFKVANDLAAEMVFVYRDSQGARRIASNRWYFYFGNSELHTPEIISPILTETHDGYAQVSGSDFKLEWVSSKGAVYEVILFEYGEWTPEEGGVTNMGISTWKAMELDVPYCVIPKEYLRPGGLFSISVSATDPETGNRTAYASDMFVILETDVQTFRLTAPFDSEMISATEDAPYYLTDNDSLFLGWAKSWSAEQYKIRLDTCLNGSFYAFGQEYVTDKTTYTIPSEDIYRSVNVHHYRLTLTAVTNSGAETSIQTYFVLGQGQPSELSLNGITLAKGKEFAPELPTGIYEVYLTTLPGMDTYTLEIYRMIEDEWILIETLHAKDKLNIMAVWDMAGEYSIKAYAANDAEKVSAGRFYLNLYQESDDPDSSGKRLALVYPDDYWINQGELRIEWTETSHGIYTLIFERYQLSDSGRGYYYQIYSQKDLVETSHIIPENYIKYNTAYKVTITSGTESITSYFKVLGPAEGMPAIEGIRYSTDEQSPAVNRSCEEIVISWPDADEIVFFETIICDAEGKIIYNNRHATDPIIISGSILNMEKSYELIMRAFDADNFSREYRAWFIMSQNIPIPTPAPTPTPTPTPTPVPEATPTPEIIDSGTSGDDVYWKLDSTGMMTIYGSGPMYNSWTKPEKALVKQIVIEDGVTSIGDSAFAAYRNVNSVIIADSVKTIGSFAFDSCISMTEVKLPAHLTTIDVAAFQSCFKLTEIIIPDEVTVIERFAFGGAGLKKVTFRGWDMPDIGENNFTSNPVVICCKGSAAESWADSNGYDVEYIDPPVDSTSTPEPTSEPTPEPTSEPTPEPTSEPTPEPTSEPTPEPTS